MQILTTSRLALLLILMGGVLFSLGCSPCSDGSGDQQLSAAWNEIQLPVVEGGEICACGKYSSCDEYVEIAYKTGDILSLVDKYKEKLKANGWTLFPSGKVRGSIIASKADKNISVDLFFTECSKTLLKPGTWSNCTNVSVKKIK
ncbi:MAG: hypothetical protein KF756_03085 [Acidobacteria bacterium]|nr:hypothetical protein [Acidobacteriota bacterium]